MAELGAGGGSGYPGVLDTDATPETDNVTDARADVPNDLADAIIKIETKLGITGGVALLDGAVIINNSEADKDFRVAAVGETNAFFVQGSDGKIGINSATLVDRLTVIGYPSIRVGSNQTNNTNKTASINSEQYASDAQTEGYTLIGVDANVAENLVYIGGGRGDVNAATQIKLYTASNTTTLGGDIRLTIDSVGRVTKPTNVSFNVRKTNAQDNFALNSAVTIVWDTEIFDIGENFASNTFTAPVTGKYLLSVYVNLLNIDDGADYYRLDLVTSNNSYQQRFDPGLMSGDPVYWTMGLTVVADMDASDTAYVTIHQANGAQQTDIAVSNYTFFTGYLLG